MLTCTVAFYVCDKGTNTIHVTSLDHSFMDSPGYNRLHPQSTDDDFNIEFANIYLTIDEP